MVVLPAERDRLGSAGDRRGGRERDAALGLPVPGVAEPYRQLAQVYREFGGGIGQVGAAVRAGEQVLGLEQRQITPQRGLRNPQSLGQARHAHLATLGQQVEDRAQPHGAARGGAWGG